MDHKNVKRNAMICYKNIAWESEKRPTNAKKANALGYDAVHDIVYEMVKDEVILYSKEKHICFIMHAHKID